jgi:hypothetical protein
MPVPNIVNWIRTGLLALPVYGLLTFWSTLDPQPDQIKNPEAWARLVGSTSYLVDHIWWTICWGHRGCGPRDVGRVRPRGAPR